MATGAMAATGVRFVQIQREVLARVRFGELEAPSDVEIIAGHLEQHREARLAPAVEASRYPADMAAALGGGVGDCGGPAAAIDVVGGGSGRGMHEDAEELDVHSTCTCGSFGIASHRAHPRMLAMHLPPCFGA